MADVARRQPEPRVRLDVDRRLRRVAAGRELRRFAVDSAAGGVCLALVLALLIAAIGSQTFYPREGSVGMWAAIGLMLRMSVQRERATSTAHEMPSIPSFAGAAAAT